MAWCLYDAKPLSEPMLSNIYICRYMTYIDKQRRIYARADCFIIGSCNSLSPVRWQALAGISDDFMAAWFPRTYLSEIVI